jgi:glycosyltransferase involved in cell wall biosynthesis
MSQRIIQILTDDSLHSRLSASSRAFAKQFSWREVGAKYERAVRIAAAGSSAGRSEFGT